MLHRHSIFSQLHYLRGIRCLTACPALQSVIRLRNPASDGNSEMLAQWHHDTCSSWLGHDDSSRTGSAWLGQCLNCQNLGGDRPSSVISRGPYFNLSIKGLNLWGGGSNPQPPIILNPGLGHDLGNIDRYHAPTLQVLGLILDMNWAC